MQLGPHRILQGDCLAVLPGLAPESFDLVVTSPPYNLDLAYSAYQDSRTEAEYLDWMVRVCTELRRVMAADGSFFLNISGSNSRPWLPFELIVRLRPLFVLQNHITWIKSIATGADSVGHYKPVAGARFLNHNHEHVFHLTLRGDVKLDRLAMGVPFKDKSNIARRGHARDLRCRGNTWFIPYRTVQARRKNSIIPERFRSICRAGASGCTAAPARACWTRSWALERHWWRRRWRAPPVAASNWTRIMWQPPRRGLAPRWIRSRARTAR